MAEIGSETDFGIILPVCKVTVEKDRIRISLRVRDYLIIHKYPGANFPSGHGRANLQNVSPTL